MHPLLSPYFFEIANREREVLEHDPDAVDAIERLSEQVWDKALKLALIEQLSDLFRSKKLSRVKVADHVGTGLTAISKWSKSGQMDRAHYLKLLQLPEFRDWEPPLALLRIHEDREIIHWIEKKIVHCRRQRARHIRIDEYEFVRAGHLIENDHPKILWEQCPTELKQIYREWTAGRLYDVMEEWGPAYRLFALEVDHAK